MTVASRAPGVGRSGDAPLLHRRSFWLTTAAIWAFFGLIVANQLYFSMRGHGHDWWRLVLWQMAGAATWVTLSPVIFALRERLPIDGPRRGLALLVHLVSAIGASLARLVPMTAVSLVLDPYRPVPTESSFGAEYAAQIPQWLPMDVALYAVILLAAEAFEAREQVHRDRLRAARLENELTAAELRALRLELQPHFLFNTMNAVVSLIRSGAAERAERMLLGLSDLLRTTLDGRRRPLVPLAEEVATTDLYLDIQRVRFGDRLRFAWRLEPGIERAAVPALLLQPLVENAVRHAVEAGDGEGSIEVAAARQGDALSISVEDSGPREGESQPEADLGTDHSTPRRERGSGLGLDNVRARLAALYGGAWTLELERRPHGGTRVLMRFPWTLMEESGA